MRKGFDHIVDKLAYDDYLRRLDVRAVLAHYGVENDREEPGRQDTTEIVHSCLLDRIERHHSNGDANPSASCNVDRKKYVCWAFWGGNMFDFIAKMEDKEDFSDILPLVRGFLGDSTLDTDTFMAELDRIFTSNPRGSAGSVLPAYDSRIINPWAFTHPFLAERGIDKDTASRLHIGWREDLNRITIPVFWAGQLVGWQARAIPDRGGQWPGTWGGSFPKYKSSPGFPKSAILYGSELGPKSLEGCEVVVVESPFSVIRATALGLDRVVVATFGAKVSQRQIDLLADAKRVIVWADDDPAGQSMERKLVRSLHRRTRVAVVPPDVGLDLGDYDSAESAEAKIESAVLAITKINEWGKI